jgi:hypothetical protein
VSDAEAVLAAIIHTDGGEASRTSLLRGDIRTHYGDFDGALEAYLESIAYDPSQAAAYQKIANLLKDFNRMELLPSIYASVQANNPAVADLEFGKALLAENSGTALSDQRK